MCIFIVARGLLAVCFIYCTGCKLDLVCVYLGLESYSLYCFVSFFAVILSFGSETWTLGKNEDRVVNAFEAWCWIRMLKRK
jgi:hypothetical protein